jgi:hypothetical protein
MSDKPLFENEDAQERVYAPQELPEGSPEERRAADEEGRARGSTVNDGVDGAVVPAIAGGVMSGPLGMSSGTGNHPGVAPAIGSAALAEETREDRDRDR